MLPALHVHVVRQGESALQTVISRLTHENRITPDQIRSAERYRRLEPKKMLPEILVELNLVAEEDVMRTASRAYGVAYAEFSTEDIDPSATELLSYDIAKRYAVFPMREEDGELVIATSNPLNLNDLDDVRALTGMRVRPVYCPRPQIGDCIDKYYRFDEIVRVSLDNLIDEAKIEMTKDHDHRRDFLDIENLCNESSVVVKLVNLILSNAIKLRASDIHIEPQSKFVQVRFRVDGSLRPIMQVPAMLRPALSARIKILAELDIAEMRKAQDGRAAILVDDRKVDLRVVISPTFYGEKIVIRLLDTREARVELHKIGLAPAESA